MKCPRCGLVIQGVELATGREYADFICADCEDEEEQRANDVIEDIGEPEPMLCGHGYFDPCPVCEEDAP